MRNVALHISVIFELKSFCDPARVDAICLGKYIQCIKHEKTYVSSYMIGHLMSNRFLNFWSHIINAKMVVISLDVVAFMS